MYERALKIREKHLGEEHPDTATSLNNLAGCYVSQQKYHHAEQLYKRALEIREHVLGAEHPEVAVSLSNLAWSYLAQREYAEAKPLYQKALEIFTNTLGAEHPTTISTSLSYKRLLEMQEQRIEKTSDERKESTGLYTQPDIERK